MHKNTEKPIKVQANSADLPGNLPIYIFFFLIIISIGIEHFIFIRNMKFRQNLKPVFL